MKKRSFLPILIYGVILIVAFSAILGMFSPRDDALPYSSVIALFNQEKVRSFQVEGDRITLNLNEKIDGKDTYRTKLADPDGFRDQMWELLQAQTESGVLEYYDFSPEEKISPYDFILPIILAGIVILLVWALLMGRMNQSNPLANFGRARTVSGDAAKNKTTFRDVAGMDEEKRELQEIVDFLRDPAKFTELGAKIPHGLLLSGPPGTGKTLLARAVAGEANVCFLSISASDFMEMYVGVGASRVRDLFEQAKKSAPAIIFIDEIDAVGRRRGSGLGGGHDEREQTLNQLLVEMDGFDRTEGVIVLAATNRPDILDPALLRPGRFDRQIQVSLPDAKGREEILKVHAKGKRLADTVDLKTVAMATVGFSGADLSNVLNEAAILTARRSGAFTDMRDINDAIMKVMAGPEKHSRMRIKKDLQMTAVHEAGHAVAMYNLPTHDPVHQISIIPRGQALGLTWSMPKEESNHLTMGEMFEQIVGLLGGRVAEALFLKDISTGASNDIDRATKLAHDMVARYGMCAELGTVSYSGGDELFIGRDFEKTKSYSDKTAATIDGAVKELIDRAYAECERILTKDKEKLKAVVSFLLENETMTGAQFADCMEGREIRPSSDTALLDDYKN